MQVDVKYCSGKRFFLGVIVTVYNKLNGDPVRLTRGSLCFARNHLIAKTVFGSKQKPLVIAGS